MFEIGDKVIYQGADKAAYKREGTVVSIEDKDGQPQLTVELDGGETFTAPIDDWSRKFNNSARNAKLAVGDKVRVWQYPIRGQYGKVVKVGLMEYDVDVDGKVYPGIDYRRVVKMPAANACTSTNSVVRNAMAAKNAAPKGLTPTTKLRLKEDFSDEYGSYRKGDVFPMYAMGGINPRFGTMMVPGRGVTLQIPWEKLEVVNSVARNAGAYDVAARAGNLFKDAYNALAGCAANLEKLTTLGQPDDVPGNDSKIASWAKDKARKVRDIMNKLDQGRL